MTPGTQVKKPLIQNRTSPFCVWLAAKPSAARTAPTPAVEMVMPSLFAKWQRETANAEARIPVLYWPTSMVSSMQA